MLAVRHRNNVNVFLWLSGGQQKASTTVNLIIIVCVWLLVMTEPHYTEIGKISKSVLIPVHKLSM